MDKSPRATSELRVPVLLCAVLFLITVGCAAVSAQEKAVVLAASELPRVMPQGFYFQGLSAPTQMRNAAIGRFGTKRYVLAGLVDTAGYAADLRAKYEGFLITDSPIMIGNSELGVGAYGFGFSDDGKLNVMDLSATEVLSVATQKDTSLRRPRPLMMTVDGNSIRLYSGRDYVIIAPK